MNDQVVTARRLTPAEKRRAGIFVRWVAQARTAKGTTAQGLGINRRGAETSAIRAARLTEKRQETQRTRAW